jgi:hypothetical protein
MYLSISLAAVLKGIQPRSPKPPSQVLHNNYNWKER